MRWVGIAFAIISCTAIVPAANLASDPTQTQGTDIDELRALLTAQQKQIEELRSALEEQKKVIDKLAPEQSNDARFSLPNTKKLGEVATTSPILPAAPAPLPSPQATSDNVMDETAPLQLKIGNAFLTPVGFMDMTAVSRSTNPGSGIGTNFGSIPYGNTQLGSLTETRFSIQNSRIGARFDTGFRDFKVLGYWESDFLGQLGNPPNGGLAVSSNPYVFRMRLYWVDVRRNNWEFLAGQSWSLMTPNRVGVSPLPGDVFFSQDMDVNYQAGLVWSRVPGFRGAYHFNNNKVSFAVALENSEPYIGGGNGGSAVTAPAAIAAAANVLGTQINNGSSVISAAALHPDIIAKLAFDPSRKFHFELAGVEITDQFSDPVSTPAFHKNTKAGGGFSANVNFELFKGFRLISNNYWSDGGGRYIFGQAPDFIIQANGNLSLVHSASTVTGFEATLRKTLLFGYYGGVYIDKNLTLDTNGKPVGYGPISSDGQNRAIQEFTVGTNSTLAKDTKWGALNLIFQYSYLQRNPWLVTGTAPTNANLSMGFVDLRYTLPGTAPSGKK